MILQDVVDLARYSEAASTAIKDNIPAIILFLNAGMLELHKKFAIKTNEHVITLVEGTTLYNLPDDFLYAIEAYGEAEVGHTGPAPEIPINDEDEPTSIFFPNHKQVQIPLVDDGAFISIIYGAKPTRYTEDDLGDELDLPEALIEPLLHYIGYKAHLGIKSGAQDVNNAHYARFQASCDNALDLGVAQPIDSYRMIHRLANRNFV